MISSTVSIAGRADGFEVETMRKVMWEVNSIRMKTEEWTTDRFAGQRMPGGKSGGGMI